MDYKGVSIVSIWFFCTSVIAMLAMRIGVNFTGVLIVMGIAVAMTFAILVIGSGKGEEKIKSLNTELSELKTTMHTMSEKIEQLTKYLEE